MTFVAFLVVPFQRTCAVTGAICGYRFAWQGHNSGLLIGSMRRWRAATVTVVLAVGLFLATLTKMITDNEFQLAWVLVLLGVVLAILTIAILGLRHRWQHRRAEDTPDRSP